MKPLSKLTEEADKLFSEWIRRKNADENGKVRCVCCGKVSHWKEIHCGHFISRDKLGTRYEPLNCHPQCPECNSRHNEDSSAYTQYILTNLPPGTIPELIRKSMMFISSIDRRILLNDVIKNMKKTGNESIKPI